MSEFYISINPGEKSYLKDYMTEMVNSTPYSEIFKIFTLLTKDKSQLHLTAKEKEKIKVVRLEIFSNRVLVTIRVSNVLRSVNFYSKSIKLISDIRYGNYKRHMFIRLMKR